MQEKSYRESRKEEYERTLDLIQDHRDRLNQIERHYIDGKLTAEQVRNLLEGTPPKKG